MDLPKFSMMKLLYPGYRKHGSGVKVMGSTTLRNLIERRVYADSKVGVVLKRGGDTSALRLSHMFNRYGGRHAIGHKKYSKTAVYTFIQDERYFSPWLALKYGDPSVHMYRSHVSSDPMVEVRGQQGIVHMVATPVSSWRRNSDHTGHLALWDCDHFHTAPDWSKLMKNLLAVEIWVTPGLCTQHHVLSTVTVLQYTDYI